MVVLSLSSDNKLEQIRLLNGTSVSFGNSGIGKENGYNFNILNKEFITFNPLMDSSSLINNIINKIKQTSYNKPIVIAISGHGELYTGFDYYYNKNGKAVNIEKNEGTKKLANVIKELNNKLDGKISSVILDMCLAAAELKPNDDSISQENLKQSPARLLSKELGEKYKILAYPYEKYSDFDSVSYPYKEKTGKFNKSLESATDNAVIFCNGKVIKSPKPLPNEEIRYYSPYLRNYMNKTGKRCFKRIDSFKSEVGVNGSCPPYTPVSPSNNSSFSKKLLKEEIQNNISDKDRCI